MVSNLVKKQKIKRKNDYNHKKKKKKINNQSIKMKQLHNKMNKEHKQVSKIFPKNESA